MTDVLTTLRTQVMPQVFGTLADAGIIERMSITRKVFTSDGAGGETQTATISAYTSVPVKVSIDGRGNRFDLQGKPVAKQTYILEFPPQTSAGVHIDIDLKTDYFVVNATGLEPAKTYKIVTPAGDVMNKFFCIRED